MIAIDFFKSIDLDQLKEDKKHLVNLRTDLVNIGFLNGKEAGRVAGVIHLMDAVQDFIEDQLPKLIQEQEGRPMEQEDRPEQEPIIIEEQQITSELKKQFSNNSLRSIDLSGMETFNSMIEFEQAKCTEIAYKLGVDALVRLRGQGGIEHFMEQDIGRYAQGLTLKRRKAIRAKFLLILLEFCTLETLWYKQAERMEERDLERQGFTRSEVNNE